MNLFCLSSNSGLPLAPSVFLLFFSYFNDLVGREVTVELKNDMSIRGTLHSVDQYLNIKLENMRLVSEEKYPHMIERVSRSLLIHKIRWKQFLLRNTFTIHNDTFKDTFRKWRFISPCYHEYSFMSGFKMSRLALLGPLDENAATMGELLSPTIVP